MSETRDGQNIVDVPKVLVDDVRELLSDDASSNELVEGQEFSDQVLAKHLLATVYDFNTAAPVLGTKLSFPLLFGEFSALRVWVVEAAMARAMKYSAIRHIKNQMPYTAGSISFDPHAVGSAMLQLAETFLTEWAQRRDSYKLNMNIQQAYSASHSELLTLGNFGDEGVVPVYGGPI